MYNRNKLLFSGFRPSWVRACWNSVCEKGFALGGSSTLKGKCGVLLGLGLWVTHGHLDACVLHAREVFVWCRSRTRPFHILENDMANSHIVVIRVALSDVWKRWQGLPQLRHVLRKFVHLASNFAWVSQELYGLAESTLLLG